MSAVDPAASLLRRRRRRRRPPNSALAAWLAGNKAPLVLLVAVVLAVLSETPALAAGARIALVGAAVLALGVAGASAAAPAEARRPGPPEWLLLALLAWCGTSFLVAAPFTKGYAATELLRVVLCAATFYVARRALRSDQLFPVAAGVLGLGVVVAAGDLVLFGQQTGNALRTSLIGTHESAGSFFLLLLPVSLAFALSTTTTEKQRLLAQATTLTLGAALLLARTRSAWIGVVVALFVLAVLRRRYEERTGKRGASPLVLLIGFALLIGAGGIAPLVSERARTLIRVGDDSSFSDRLFRWRAAARMASERPLAGWGLGAYTVRQGRWTHQGDDVPEVLARGTGHQNLAHNFYVQWAADTGGVGVVLVVAFVVAVVRAGLRALPVLPPSSRRTLLVGGIAALAGVGADAVGSPAYAFPGVSIVAWLWMGVILAATRGPRLAETPAAGALLVPISAGIAVALLILGTGHAQRIRGRSVPRGTLRLVAKPGNRFAPGGTLSWSALYTGASGVRGATMPGTTWTVSGLSNSGAHNAPTALLVRRRSSANKNEPDRSGLRITLPRAAPPPAGPVTVTATYFDDYGRRYQARALVSATP